MVDKRETKSEAIEVVRFFDAPRELVFKAWSHADHIKRWFSPEHLTTPFAEVDFRSGGVFALEMQLPDGTRNRMDAIFTSIVPPESLIFAGIVRFAGHDCFRVETQVSFADEHGGTRLNVRQSYEILDPAFAGSVAGASEGWRTTLDKLAREVGELKSAPPPGVAHGAFTIRRVLPVSPERVFQAFAEPEAKGRWFTGPPGYQVVERVMDVRVGGRERLKGLWPSGMVTTFDAVYLDVVPNQRLIYAYEMWIDERKISVSLASLSLAPDPAGTQLTLTEQGAFLDGHADNGMREQGSGMLMDALQRSLSAP